MEAERFRPVSMDQRSDGNDPARVPNRAEFSLSIVVPVYKEEGNVPEFLNRIGGILSSISSEYEIVFCLDPSPDRTEELILQARQKDPRIKLLRFSRRFGQPMATLAGLQYSSGDAAIVMDVDLHRVSHWPLPADPCGRCRIW
jgi:cellulose synthase/poly-beta-1,6-N-acetylglucosamine synthase-like glycosyltransferase